MHKVTVLAGELRLEVAVVVANAAEDVVQIVLVSRALVDGACGGGPVYADALEDVMRGVRIWERGHGMLDWCDL